MAATLPDRMQSLIDAGVLVRLPLTFLPFVNQQINQWQFLFPNERHSVERLLTYVSTLSPAQSSALFRDVVQLEDKMGVHQWQFSTAEQTIQNSSQLARSPYFQQWRRAVQAVFDAADLNASANDGKGSSAQNRLILLSLPQALPLNAETAWRKWAQTGKRIKLDLTSLPAGRSALNQLLLGSTDVHGLRHDGLLPLAKARPAATNADTWIIDGGRSLVESIRDASGGHVQLSYLRLDTYRQNFSHEMNTMRKDLDDADAVIDRLRKVDVSAWCPSEVAADPAVREFVRALYLSGNGAVIFANSFVEWAASEALRRARPTFIAAEFGMRTKPKPFTGVAVFDNPEQINPLPPVDDPQGSAVDAEMLALYIWLAAARYSEYQQSTICLCIAESLAEAYIVAPPEFSPPGQGAPVTLNDLSTTLGRWIA